jgi:hypothetical protein
MNPWQDKSGEKKMLVNLVEGNEAYDKVQQKVKDIRSLLSFISTEMERYESLNSPDYGHVGDLAHVEDQLDLIWDFLSQTS